MDEHNTAPSKLSRLVQLGFFVLAVLGVGILFVAGVTWQSPASISWTVRDVVRLAILLSLVLWIVALFLFLFMVLWWRELELFLRRVEQRWFGEALEHIEERLSQASVEQLNHLASSLASVRESVDELHRTRSSDVGWQETLYHAFLLLSEAENEERLYENVVTAFVTLTSCEQVMLFLGENELGPLVLVAAIGLSPAVMEEWKGKEWRPPLWGVVAPALAKRRPYSFQVRHVEGGQQPHEFPWEIAGERLLALPLVGIQTIQGVVVLVDSDGARTQSRPHIRVLELVAQFAGRTLENIRLARAIQEHMSELVTVQSLTRALASASSLDEMLAMLDGEIAQIAGPSYVAVILKDDIPKRRVRTSFPPNAPEYPCLMERIDWRVVRWVYDAVQPVFYTPGEVDEDVGNVMFETSGTVMVVPIEGREATQGVLVVVSRDDHRAFEEPHLVGMRTVAAALAVGLAAVQHNVYSHSY